MYIALAIGDTVALLGLIMKNSSMSVHRHVAQAEGRYYRPGVEEAVGTICRAIFIVRRLLEITLGRKNLPYLG